MDTTAQGKTKRQRGRKMKHKCGNHKHSSAKKNISETAGGTTKNSLHLQAQQYQDRMSLENKGGFRYFRRLAAVGRGFACNGCLEHLFLGRVLSLSRSRAKQRQGHVPLIGKIGLRRSFERTTKMDKSFGLHAFLGICFGSHAWMVWVCCRRIFMLDTGGGLCYNDSK